MLQKLLHCASQLRSVLHSFFLADHTWTVFEHSFQNVDLSISSINVGLYAAAWHKIAHTNSTITTRNYCINFPYR
jgi:hypothetical protein